MSAHTESIAQQGSLKMQRNPHFSNDDSHFIPSSKPAPVTALLALSIHIRDSSAIHGPVQSGIYSRCGTYIMRQGLSRMRGSSNSFDSSAELHAFSRSILLAKNRIGTGLAAMSVRRLTATTASDAKHAHSVHYQTVPYQPVRHYISQYIRQSKSSRTLVR